jgi:hypothetical protein
MKQRIWPLTGVIGVAFVVAAFVVGGETPDVNDSAQKVASFYKDNDTEQIVGAILIAYATVFLVFFLGALCKALRTAEGEQAGLSVVAFGGGVIQIVGMTIFGGLTFTLADAADDLDPSAMQSLNALNSDLFLPLAVGTGVLLLASGISTLTTGALPKWLGWIAIVLGIAAVTPIGFFAFLLYGLWVIAVSVVLARRAAAAAPVGGGQAPGV